MPPFLQTEAITDKKMDDKKIHAVGSWGGAR
jgi:hypothetical protein